MTLRQLLSHTAGIPDDLPWSCAVEDASLEAWFAGPYPWPVWSTPGAVWNYSNAGNNLLGAVLERASGRFFPDLVAQRVLAPLGMRSATFRADEATAASHAIGHDREDAEDVQPHLYRMEAHDCARARPASALHASVLDLARLAEALLDGGRGIVDAAQLQTLGAQVSTGLWGSGEHRYGLGLYGLPHKGVQVLSHDGVVAGFGSQLLIAPERGLAIAVVSNAAWARPGKLGWIGLELFGGLPPEAEAHPVTYSAPEDLERWVGRYDHPWELGPEHTWGETEIARDRRQLWLTLPGVPDPLPLEQVDGGAFGYALDGITQSLRFADDPSGARWLVQRKWVAHGVAPADGAGVPAP